MEEKYVLRNGEVWKNCSAYFKFLNVFDQYTTKPTRKPIRKYMRKMERNLPDFYNYVTKKMLEKLEHKENETSDAFDSILNFGKFISYNLLYAIYEGISRLNWQLMSREKDRMVDFQPELDKIFTRMWNVEESKEKLDAYIEELKETRGM